MINLKNIYRKIEKLITKKNKKQAELLYWANLFKKNTCGCQSISQREKKLLEICHKITFPRYKKDLYIDENSFKGKRVLDVGCGPHGGLIGFKESDKYGVDHLIKEYEKIGYPLEKHKIKYCQAKSEKLPFPDSFFDVVVCVNALDHVDSLQHSIKEISRVIKKGGYFIGQINFRITPTITEPIVLNHKSLISIFLKNNLLITKRIFQYSLNKEDRYYYECEKK